MSYRIFRISISKLSSQSLHFQVGLHHQIYINFGLTNFAAKNEICEVLRLVERTCKHLLFCFKTFIKESWQRGVLSKIQSDLYFIFKSGSTVLILFNKDVLSVLRQRISIICSNTWNILFYSPPIVPSSKYHAFNYVLRI